MFATGEGMVEETVSAAARGEQRICLVLLLY
jgi:hypothetical protein